MEYLVVDVDNRKINIPESITHLGVKDDNETRTLNFRMPKIYKGLDMSGYTIEINYINAKGKADSALAGNIQVGDEEITFQWCAGGTAYAKDGKVRFLVYTYLENEDLTKTNEWHTTWATLEVLDGGNVEEQIAEENPRIIEEMRRRIRDLENGEAGGTKDAIQYIEQELTDEQKAQARVNIGAASEEDVSKVQEQILGLKENGTGGSEVEISETEPTNENTDLWINPSDDEEVHIYTAEEIDEKMPKKLSDLDIDMEIGGEIPVFDLTEMGLEYIPTGEYGIIHTDTTELLNALENGSVDIVYAIGKQGDEITSRLITTRADIETGNTHLGSIRLFVEDLYLDAEIFFIIGNGFISTTMKPIEKASGGSSEIQVFDLTEMGLPAVPMIGDGVYIDVDTTELRNALAKGVVKAKVNVIYNGYTLPYEFIATSCYIAYEDRYVCSAVVPSGNQLCFAHVFVETGKISARCDVITVSQ